MLFYVVFWIFSTNFIDFALLQVYNKEKYQHYESFSTLVQTRIIKGEL
mgnify:CR=1 FL=1